MWGERDAERAVPAPIRRRFPWAEPLRTAPQRPDRPLHQRARRVEDEILFDANRGVELRLPVRIEQVDVAADRRPGTGNFECQGRWPVLRHLDRGWIGDGERRV